MTTSQVCLVSEASKVIRAIDPIPDLNHPEKTVKVLVDFLKSDLVTEERFESFFKAFHEKCRTNDVSGYATFLDIASKIACNEGLVRDSLKWLIGILLPSLKEFQKKSLTMPAPREGLVVPPLPYEAVHYLTSTGGLPMEASPNVVPFTAFQRLLILLDRRNYYTMQLGYWLLQMLSYHDRWCLPMQEILSMAADRLEERYASGDTGSKTMSGTQRLANQLKTAMMLSMEYRGSIGPCQVHLTTAPVIDVMLTLSNTIRQNVK